MDIKEQIAVMQAFADGEQIEYKPILLKDWALTKRPCWNWTSYNYRIAPKPLQVELWGIVSKKHGVLQMYHNKQDAINIHVPHLGQRVVKFICTEVPENAA